MPVDATAPAERGRRILTDCDIRALIVNGSCLDVTPQGEGVGRLSTVVVTGPIPDSISSLPNITPWERAIADPSDLRDPSPDLRDPSDLAYILYTSGSTGMPKGAMISHENAVSFIDWCSAAFAPTEHDRFSSHPPFHFDPSVVRSLPQYQARRDRLSDPGRPREEPEGPRPIHRTTSADVLDFDALDPDPAAPIRRSRIAWTVRALRLRAHSVGKSSLQSIFARLTPLAVGRRTTTCTGQPRRRRCVRLAAFRQ